MTEPTITEQLAVQRQRLFDAELALAKAQVLRDLALAQQRAAHAEARTNYMTRRVDELEAALARRQRAAHDHRQGLERFRPKVGG